MQTSRSDIPVFGDPLPGREYRDRPAAYAVIRNCNGDVAAVQGNRGCFLPGGGALPGETPEATIRREVREELGRHVGLISRIGEAVQYFEAEGQYYRMQATFFRAEFSDEPSGQGEYALLWLPMTTSEEAFFHACHVWAIREAQEGRAKGNGKAMANTKGVRT